MQTRAPALVVALLFVGLAAVTAPRALAITWEKVAYSGEAAPGLPGTQGLGVFDPPQVTTDGRVILRGSFYGIHVWRPGEALAVLVSTSSFSNDPPRTLCSLFELAANPSGAVAFHAEEQQEGATGCYERAAYGPADASGATRVARSGDVAPGEPGDFAFVGFYFSYKPSIAIDALGRVAFFAAIDDLATPATSLETALFGPDFIAGLPTQIARTGAPAFGDPSMRTWEDLLDFRFNDVGQVAFSGTLAATERQIYAPTALHRYTPGAGSVVVMQTGEVAPGVPGAVFQALGEFDLDDSGRVAFDALLDPSVGAVTLLDDHGIWVTDPSGVAMLRHREGDAAPGVPGAVFGLNPGIYPFGAPRINDFGELAFSGWMLDSGVEVAGLWGPDAQGAASLRVRGGDPAPGLSDVTLAWFELLAFNDEREIIFVAHLAGADVDQTNDRAWYFQSAAGEATLLLREGDRFELAPGDTQAASAVDPQIGANPAFSRIAVLLDFDDAYSPSPAAIYSTTVPEPVGGGACALLVLACMARRIRGSRRTLGVLLAAALGAMPFEAGAVSWLPVARSGDVAPGFPGSDLESFEVVPEISDAGELFFHGFTPYWEEPSQILYAWTVADGASIVAAAGSEQAGFDLQGLYSVHANASGEIAYAATRSLRCIYCVGSPEMLVGPAAPDLLAITAQSGDPAIGGPVDWVLRGGFAGSPSGFLGSMRYYNQPVFNDAGQMIAHARIGTPELAPGVEENDPNTSAEALYFFDPQTGPTLIARTGDDAPGFPAGAKLTYIGWTQGLAANAVVAFTASATTVAGPAMTGIYRWSATDGLALLARKGDAIPGEPVRTLFGVTPPVVDATGNVAFVAMAESLYPAPLPYDLAIWLVDAAGVLTIPVPFEAAAPGLPSGAFFTFIWRFLLADDGAIAFAASAVLPDESNTNGIWLREANGQIRKLIADGDSAPGIPAARFGKPAARKAGADLLALSAHGAVAFAATIEGDSIDASNDQVFYRIHPNGRAELLLREGDPFEFAAGDVRPVQSATFTFDRDLEFAAAEITSGDASAIYFSALPEPGATLLGGIAIAALVGIARARMRSAS